MTPRRFAKLAAGICAALALALPPRAAWADADTLKNAENTFEYGNYARSCELAESLLAAHQLTGERDLVAAYRIAGLSNFFLGRLAAARQQFVALLSVDPDYAMDPFLVPPAAVAFFDGVKRDNESLLAPIRERRKAMAEQQRLADEARRRLMEENLMHQFEPNQPTLVKTVSVHPWAANFVPFGVGQFQEDRAGMGVLFAGTQLIGLGAAAGCFAKIESLRDPHGLFAQADYGTAKNLATAKWAGLGLFMASAVLGIADSIWNYQATTTRIEALPQPAQHPSPQPPPSAEPKPHATLTPWLTDKGAGLGVGVRF